jgi:hypothetical protein
VVGDVRAIVTHVSDAISVAVPLRPVGRDRAVVQTVRHAIPVLIEIRVRAGGFGVREQAGLGHRAGVTSIANAVPVDVPLVVVGHVGAVVTGIANPVEVRVPLVAVRNVRAVVEPIGHAVAVAVVLGRNNGGRGGVRFRVWRGQRRVPGGRPGGCAGIQPGVGQRGGVGARKPADALLAAREQATGVIRLAASTDVLTFSGPGCVTGQQAERDQEASPEKAWGAEQGSAGEVGGQPPNDRPSCRRRAR